MTKTEQQEQTQRALAEAIGSKYQILCRIGGGGMAQVFLARHRLHGGLFAVKVLAEHLAQDPSIVGRFEQEARMAASLASHPNIVPIFDIGEGNGLHYLVMQFIAGEDLCSLTKREGPLPPAAAANVVAQAAEALSCAEAKRIVHRDLKLANMLLDEGGRVKLLDFGISKITDIADGLTRPGESLGTPFYMSPEQIRGEGCDIRSDLYSLGVVFFELLTGRRPFENDSATAVQMAHLATPPPSLLTVDPALPPACDMIVQKLLAKRREDRYQSTAKLLEDLFAHGASAGPGLLRPVVDPGLMRAMASPVEPTAAPRTRLEAGASAETSRAPVQTDGAANGLSSAVSASASVAPQMAPSTARRADEGATAPEQRAPSGASPSIPVSQSTTSRAGLAVGLLVVLLVVAGAAGWLLFRPKPPQHVSRSGLAAPASTRAVLPSVIEGPHGRMVLVASGPFLFGGDGVEPETRVTLPGFYLDETEVSNEEYRRFCEATGHPAPQTPDYANSPNKPVSGVSLADAQAYARWAGKRLPTEQEWEKGARGTDARTYPWGSEAWAGDVPTHLVPVRAYPARRSPYGAYNMAGNVWEWTSTRYAYTPAEAARMKQLTGGTSFSSDWYSTKGGSFAPGGADFAIARRRGLPADARSPWIGFRCVRDAPS